MCRNREYARAICRLLVVCVAAASSAAVPALAQEPQSDSVETIVVTGSRIAQPNQTSTSPIQVVSEKDIELGGRTDVTDIINLLPQNMSNMMGQDLGNRSSGLTTAGGVATADLRGLGPNRTLVLVNGRRLGAGSPNTVIQAPAPDLDQIPAALVERVEVVTGGASAVYGSDAIAGVVNFIMKRNFEGFQIEYQVGQNWHQNQSSYVQGLVADFGDQPLTGSSHDGRNQAVNIIAGTNFADGKGNLTAYLSYLDSDAVPSGDRDYGGCQLFANDTLNGAVCGGSSNANQFRLTGTTTDYQVAGNQFVPFGSAASNPPPIFNSQKYIYMGRADKRYAAGFMGHVELNAYANPYFELTFMNDRTDQEIAPSALFKDSNPLDPISNNYNVNCSNPLLSAQEAAILCTPAQIAADALVPGSVSANVRIGRRNVEGGGRHSDYEHTNYRAVAGLEGEFASVWSYDAYAQYYYTQFYNSNDRYLNFQSIGNALQVTGTAANPVCISGPPCMPYNIFTEGAVTPEQLDYLYLSGTAYGTTTQRTIHGDVTAELDQYHVKSPLAIEGLAVNLGFEHRAENVRFQPDSAENSGLLSGFGGAQVPIDSGYSVSEAFIELRAPLVQDRPGVKDLVFDAGFRRSDYSTSGVFNTHKLELQYAPVADFRFRGSYQRAIRAPSLIELFNPQVIGQIQVGVDPCAPTTDTAGNLVPATATLAQCQYSGVTAAQYGNGGTTNTIPQGTAGQLTQLQGGNPDLDAEEGTSYTFGITFSPGFAPGLTGSIDYYRIDLEGAVGAIPARIILNNCHATGDPTYCSQLVRSSQGGLNGASVAQGGYIKQTSVNISAAKVSGIDLQASYKLPLSARWGSLLFAMNGAWLDSIESTPLPGAHTYDCAGLFGSTCQTVNSRWHHVLRTSWETPGNVVVATTWRYMSAVKLDNNDPDPSLQFVEFGAYNSFNARIPSYSYIDLSASWNFGNGFQLRGGINNLFDKDPPIVTTEIVSGGAANSYEAYDGMGRQLFMTVTAKF